MVLMPRFTVYPAVDNSYNSQQVYIHFRVYRGQGPLVLAVSAKRSSLKNRRYSDFTIILLSSSVLVRIIGQLFIFYAYQALFLRVKSE